MSSAEPMTVVSAFTEEQASRLTGVSIHQLRYWDRTKLFVPEFADENRRAAYSRIYSFNDIASLRVLNVLRKQYSISVQHLRDVADKLCEMDNSAWARTVLYVLKKRVNFVDPEDGRQKEVVSGQYALGIPLEKVVSDTKRDIAALSVRDPAAVGNVEQNRFVVSNAPVVAGTRVPVAAIKSFADAGFTVDQIIKEYPSLTRADVQSAISFQKIRAA